MWKLMAATVCERFGWHVALPVQLFIQFRARISVRNGDLNGFCVDFLRKIDRALDRLPRFTWKSDDEISVDANSHFLAVVCERASLLDCRALLDVFQDLRITGLKSYNEESGPSVGHGIQCFIIAVDAGGTGPSEAKRL